MREGTLLCQSWLRLPSQREGDVSFRQRFSRICWLHNILQKHWTVCTHRRKTYNQSRDKINPFKWNRGVTVMSINIKSHKVSFSQAVKGMIFWGSVNSTVVLTGASWVCLQGLLLLLPSQAVWRTASTQIAPAGWISQSLMAFMEVAITYSALLGIMLP